MTLRRVLLLVRALAAASASGSNKLVHALADGLARVR